MTGLWSIFIFPNDCLIANEILINFVVCSHLITLPRVEPQYIIHCSILFECVVQVHWYFQCNFNIFPSWLVGWNVISFVVCFFFYIYDILLHIWSEVSDEGVYVLNYRNYATLLVRFLYNDWLTDRRTLDLVRGISQKPLLLYKKHLKFIHFWQIFIVFIFT